MSTLPTTQIRLIALAAAIMAAPLDTAKSAPVDRPMSPKEVVNAFDKMAFFDHKPIEAVTKYFAPGVIEHDPTTATGRAAIIAYMKKRDWKSDKMQDRIYRVITEGDLVVVHHHVLGSKPGDNGLAAVDIFRVENGSIVEHWDVLQAVPPKSANNNTMF